MGFTWTGEAHNTAWDNAKNWEPMQVPKDGDDIVVPGNTMILGPVVPGDMKIGNLELGENGILMGGKVTVTKKFNFNGGNLRNFVDIEDSAELSFSGEHPKFITGSIITNNGTMKVEGTGIITMSEGSGIVNKGRTEITSTSTFTWSSGSPVSFDNYGTIVLRSLLVVIPITSCFSGVGLRNHGQIQADSGILSLEKGLGGTHLFYEGTRISGGLGDGRVRLANGGAGVVQGTLFIDGGGVLEVTENSFLNPGSVPKGTPAPYVSCSGTLLWTGGSISSKVKIEAAGTLRLAGKGDKMLSEGSIENEGLIEIVEEGSMRFGGGGTITNRAMMEFRHHMYFKYGSGTGGKIDNRGTFKITGASSSTHEFPQVKIKGINLDSQGPFQIERGQLRLEEGTYTLKEGTGITGEGRFVLAGGTLKLDRDVLVDQKSTFELTGTGIIAAVQPTWKLQCQGLFVWTGGNVTCNILIQEQGVVHLTGVEKKYLSVGRITNKGTIRWDSTGTLTAAAAGTIINQGLIEMTGLIRMYWSSGTRVYLENEGTIKVNAGKAEMADISMNNKGRIEIKEAGTLYFKDTCEYRQLTNESETYLKGGTLQAVSAIRIEGGTVKGAGTINGPLRNVSGIVNPGNTDAEGVRTVGEIKVTGAYTQDTGGETVIYIGGDTMYSRLRVAGAANLNGKLTVQMPDTYIPADGVFYQVLPYGSRTGKFAKVIRPILPEYHTVLEHYNAADLTMEAVSTALLANRILNTAAITLATDHESGVPDLANARQNIVDTANGLPATRSNYGTAHGGTVQIHPYVLVAMVLLAETYTFTVSEVVGGSHSENSLHYQGVVFDVNILNGRHIAPGHATIPNFTRDSLALGAFRVFGPGDPGHENHLDIRWHAPTP